MPASIYWKIASGPAIIGILALLAWEWRQIRAEVKEAERRLQRMGELWPPRDAA